ncbi:GntR family transcriptional regulator [Candidatus Sumerlaeota bacterium]|nr:GntR family transcriptional regulator [Candidatus Sumerlaeota bacterium]
MPKLTKHRLICETIKSDILNGTYSTGSRIPPETELTKRFKASRMTVNRAIKELQMSGYVCRTRGSGTYVLSRQVSEPRLLAIMVAGIPDQGIFSRLVRSIEEAAFTLGYSVILCNANNSFEKAESYIKDLLKHGVSGIFFSPIYTDDSQQKCMRENRKLAQLFVENRIPFVCIDSLVENFEPLNFIVPDNEAAAYNLMIESINHGHKKCLIIHTILNSSSRSRINGAKQALIERGLGAHSIRLMHLKQFLSLKTSQFDKILKEGFTLIYTIDDLIALQALNRLKDWNIHVPDALSLVSHDDLEFAEGFGLTTVHQNLEKEGEEAVLAMHRLLKEEVTNIRQMLPSKLIVRRTLGAAPSKKD